MRTTLFLLPLLTLATFPIKADENVNLTQLKEIGLLPKDKLSLRPEDTLDPGQGNPFAERAKAKKPLAVETVETEEIKIRRVFDALKIDGIIKGQGKYSALLGDLDLEEGAQVPPVIPNQTQILRVTVVTAKKVELAWVEGFGSESAIPRKIVKTVGLAPRVGVKLAGQPAGNKDAPAMTYIDENGKVIWPKRMSSTLSGMLDNLPTGTADLSEEEKAVLMEATGLEDPGVQPNEALPPAGMEVDSPSEDPVESAGEENAESFTSPPPASSGN